MLSRAIRFVNRLLTVILLAAAIAAWWFLWRTLPQTSGTVDTFVHQPVSVKFDTLGVPHIEASSLEDALYVQGFVTAQDRMWQMDALRRSTAGELSEILGPIGLDADREARRLRLRHVAEDAYQTLPAADRAAFEAYARGVNGYIAGHWNRLPIEFTLLGYRPKPWTAVDSILVCLHMFRVLTITWRDELVKKNFLTDGDAAKVRVLFPVTTGADVQPGSNAWAIAGRHTASGKPLLSNDMHLEPSLPGIWYMAHLKAPGLDVSGVSLPGTPGIIAGHNRRIAWGITNLQFDVQDLYIENFDVATGKYRYQGREEQASLDREVIRIKGQPATELGVWVTRHGPLFVTENGQRMALRWSAAQHGAIEYPILDIDRAENWRQFTAALSRFPGPGQNFVYADVDGNIGYHAAGKLPRRRGPSGAYAGDLPVSGEGDYDWDGFIPFDQLPSVFNPPGGMIVTANQNPFPPGVPYAVNGNFAPPYRAHQIRERLTSHEGWRAADLLGVQTDVYSAFHHFLAGQLVAASEKHPSRNPSVAAAVALLRGWNGQMDKDLAAPFVAALAYLHLRTAVGESASPGKGLAYDFPMNTAVIEKLLRERPAGWFPDYDELLARTLEDAVEEGIRIQGRDLGRWRYGAWLRVTVNHPLFHRVPLVGTYFDLGVIPMSGAATTVKQTSVRLAPSMRMDADLGDWDRSLLNTQTGQSGHPFSSHYRDQWKAYYWGQSFPMQFEQVHANSTLEFRPAAR